MRITKMRWAVVVKATQKMFLGFWGFLKWVFLGIVMVLATGSVFQTIEIVAALRAGKAKGRGKVVAR